MFLVSLHFQERKNKIFYYNTKFGKNKLLKKFSHFNFFLYFYIWPFKSSVPMLENRIFKLKTLNSKFRILTKFTFDLLKWINQFLIYSLFIMVWFAKKNYSISWRNILLLIRNIWYIYPNLWVIFVIDIYI